MKTKKLVTKQTVFKKEKKIENKSTPGPWKSQRRGGSDYGREIVADNGRRVVCETICSEHEANARLIAASPALLEKLENLEDAATVLIERWESGDLADAVRSLVVDRNNARIIISLAKGET